MKLRYVLIAALVLALGGAQAALADPGQGMTPSYGAPWSAQYAGPGVGEATGVSGAPTVNSVSGNQVAPSAALSINSGDVDILMSSQDLVKAAEGSTVVGNFGDSMPEATYQNHRPIF